MLLQGNCVKEITASGGGTLVAPAGQSLLIRNIYCEPSSNDSYLTCQVDRVTVAFWRLKGLTGNHLSFIEGAGLILNMTEFLAAKGINISIPIAEGQTFTVSRYAETGKVLLVFDRYDAGDIHADMPNGSDAKEYIFMQYMDIVTGVSASGDALFDTSLSPAEFPDFPCGKAVPANYRITLLGLVGTPWQAGESGPKGYYTTHIKLIREREVLFDEDRNGIPFYSYYTASPSLLYEAAFTLIGSGMHNIGSGMKGTGEPLIFSPTLVFDAGVELNIYAVMVLFGTTPTWSSGKADLAAILKVEKI